jgi:hypothetical protein
LALHLLIFAIALALGYASRLHGAMLLGVWLAAAMAYAPWLGSEAAHNFWTRLTGDQTYYAERLETVGLSLSQIINLLLFTAPVLLPAGVWLVYWFVRRTQQTWARLLTTPTSRIILFALFCALLLFGVATRGYTLKRQLLLLWGLAVVMPAFYWPWPLPLQPATRGGRALKVMAPKVMVPALVALSLIAGLINIYWTPKEQWREAVAWLHASAQPGDLVLIAPRYMSIPFDYYHNQYTESTLQRAAIDATALERQLPELYAAHPRIWWVAHTQDLQSLSELQAWLHTRAPPTAHHSFHHIEIQLYAKQ